MQDGASIVSPIRPASSLHAAVLNSKSVPKSQEGYDAWCQLYDSDLDKASYILPKITAELCCKYATNGKDTVVLDVGGGTGLVGHYLRNNEGYAGVIDILDANMEMLYVASKKTLNYRNIIRHWVDVKLPLCNDTYDAVTCIGAILPQHCPPSTIEAMLNVVKPNGVIVFNISQTPTPSFNSAVGDLMRRLQDEKKMVLVEERTQPVYNTEGKTVLYVYKKL